MCQRPKQKNRQHQVNQQPDGPKRADRNHVHGFPPISTTSARAQCAPRTALFSNFIGAMIFLLGLRGQSQIQGCPPLPTSRYAPIVCPISRKYDLYLTDAYKPLPPFPAETANPHGWKNRGAIRLSRGRGGCWYATDELQPKHFAHPAGGGQYTGGNKRLWLSSRPQTIVDQSPMSVRE